MGYNDSGTGPSAVLPAELRGLNAGAFFLNWIWAIAHSTWIGLLCLIPCVGTVMAFVLLFKGNEYAWQNRRWESVEQFKAVQKKWTMWGVGIIVVSVLLNILSAVLIPRSVSTLPSGTTTTTLPATP
ncbi:MAG: hypothetical protein EOO38_18570 [Cytophagaceae bacterium]|nr:MAG: hypothetical protein EOO38_18570 [Cytophagaceae bacterium]